MLCRLVRGITDLALVIIITLSHSCTISTSEDEKIELLTNLIAKEPGNSDALFKRGKAYSQKKDFKKAIMDYTRAIDIEHDMTKAYLFRGFDFIELDDYEKGIPDLDRVIDGERHEAILFVAHVCRGYAYHKLGDYDSAVEDYRKAFAIDPQYVVLDIKEAKERAVNFFD